MDGKALVAFFIKKNEISSYEQRIDCLLFHRKRTKIKKIKKYLMYLVDEYNTSKKCSVCHKDLEDASAIGLS